MALTLLSLGVRAPHRPHSQPSGLPCEALPTMSAIATPSGLQGPLQADRRGSVLGMGVGGTRPMQAPSLTPSLAFPLSPQSVVSSLLPSPR